MARSVKKFNEELWYMEAAKYIAKEGLYDNAALVRVSCYDETARGILKLCYGPTKSQKMNYNTLLSTILYLQTMFYGDRFNYACNIVGASKDVDTADWEDYFKGQGVDFKEFSNAVYAWLTLQSGKRNTLHFIGPPSTGKTMTCTALTRPFLCGIISKADLLNGSFPWAPLVNKAIGVIEEPLLTPALAQDAKSIMGGAAIQVNVKYQDPCVIQDTPIIVTTNHHAFGQGFVSSKDEEALRTRCLTFKLTRNFTPSTQMTSRALYSFILKNKTF